MSRRAPRVDAAVLEACQRGEAEAFAVLFRHCRASIRALALRFTADADLADDVTQQVFVTLLGALAGFRHEARFETWLYCIVANTCLRERRRLRRLVPLQSADPEPPHAGTHEQDYLRLEEARAVRRAILSLPPKLRRPLVLRYMEGLSYQELSATLGCSTGTVASRLNRARGGLASKLASRHGPSDPSSPVIHD